MMKKRITWGNSLFFRLLAALIGLIMIPIYGVGTILYNRSINAVSDEISKTEIVQITYSLKDLENEIERIRLQQYDCLLDENLNMLNYAWDILSAYERYQNTIQLKHRLFSIKNSSKYIGSAIVYMPQIERVVSDQYINRVSDYEKYTSGEMPTGGEHAPLLYWKNSLLLTTKKADARRSDLSPVVIIELDGDELQRMLAPLNLHENSGVYLFDRENAFSIKSTTGTFDDAAVQQFMDAEGRHREDGVYTEVLGGDQYFISFARSDSLNMTLCRFLPANQFLDRFDLFYAWAWLYAIVVLIAVGIYSLSTYRMVHRPLQTLVSAFKRMESGDLSVSVEPVKKDEFGYLYSHFNRMAANLNTLIDQVYTQKILTQRAELKSLQSQINPHFLYNSFFIISTMAKVKDNEGLEIFSRHLGEYFQYITRSGVEEIPLLSEVRHARIYTEIQAVRFSNRIAIEFEEIPAEYNELIVPRLILQPLIENAFEHGLEKQLEVGAIRIYSEVTELGLTIFVEDNGAGMTEDELEKWRRALATDEKSAEVTGILNIHRRLRLKFGEKSGLTVSKGSMNGTKIALMIAREG